MAALATAQIGHVRCPCLAVPVAVDFLAGQNE